MNKLKLVLLCPFLAVTFSYGMEQAVELTAHPVHAVAQQSRVPSLKHLILSKIGSLLIKQNEHVSISALDQIYQGAAADCARVLAEDERVALWDKFGSEKKTVELDHCALIANGFADEVKENTVYAATFTPDDQFLLTLSCKKDVQANYVLNVWRVSDFGTRLEAQHAADALQAVAAVLETTVGDGTMPQAQATAAVAATLGAEDTAPQVIVPFNEEAINGVALNQEMLKQPEPIKPCSEFVIRPMNYCFTDSFKIVCDSTSSTIVITLPYGDCYFFKLTQDGALSRHWRFNVLPLAKELRPTEGSQEENQLYQDDPIAHVELLALNSIGTKLLIHLKTSEENRRTGELYCFPIGNDALFAQAPIINPLDDTSKIASNVEAAVWRQDDTISFIDMLNYRLLLTVDTEGKELSRKELRFTGVHKIPLRPNCLTLRKNSDQLFIFSTYFREHNCCNRRDLRIDKCNLTTGECIRLHDRQNQDDEIHFIDINDSPRQINVTFLNNERFALKMYSESGEGTVKLWDIEQDCSTNITAGQTSGFAFTRAVSHNERYLFLSDQPLQGMTCRFNCVLFLETPHASHITLKQLIGLCNKE